MIVSMSASQHAHNYIEHDFGIFYSLLELAFSSGTLGRKR